MTFCSHVHPRLSVKTVDIYTILSNNILSIFNAEQIACLHYSNQWLKRHSDLLVPFFYWYQIKHTPQGNLYYMIKTLQ